MKTFSVPTDPYGDGRLYSRKDILFKPHCLSILVGCNGSGKSTLMRLIKDKLKNEDNVLVFSYDDRSDGGSHLMSRMGFYSDFEGLSGMLMSSEGEKIYRGVGDFVTGLGRKIHENSPKELWIFMDAVGSGLSIDKIREIKEFSSIVFEDNPETDVYFVISTNEYEFAENSDCIDVTTFKHMTFESYDSYRDYILKTADKKEKRYASKT